MRALAFLVLLAALVAGCGAGDPVAAEQIAAAAQRTVETGSSRIEVTGTDGEDSFTISGAADYEEKEAQLTFSGTVGGASEEGELRLADDTFYLRVPHGLGGLAADKPWLAVTLPNERHGSLEDLVLPFPLVDPGELLESFEEVGGEVTRLGEQELRGATAEGYRLELDLARLVERAPAKVRDRLRSALEEREETTLPVEVWIDGDDRLRRVSFSSDGKQATADFFDFGTDVDVQAPPQDEVFDLSSMLEDWKSTLEEDD